MLVLCQRKSEVLAISGGIVVTVLAVKGKKIRFRIDALAEIALHRGEVLASFAESVQGFSVQSSGKRYSGLPPDPDPS